MTATDRVTRWLTDLDATLARAADLAARGHIAFESDDALPLACEALSNRIGDLSKRLVAADGERFSAPIWRQAARNRDYAVHHYDRIDTGLLWQTVTTSFPLLHAVVNQELAAE